MSSSEHADALPRRVLVTGASRGLGEAIARALIAAEVRVALVGRELKALQAVIGAASGHVAIEADLGRERDVEGCVAAAVAGLGGLDGFVSCAGIAEYAAVGAITAASIARQAQVNWVAPLLLAQAVAPELERSGGGSMLMVASTLGLKPAPMTAVYAATKAALVSVTRSLAIELGPRAIRVNAIAPGVVDTAMVRVVRTAPGEVAPVGDQAARRIEAQLEQLRTLHPLQRLGSPQEIAESALYLLSARYVTGAIVNVDGGLLLGQGEL